MKITQIRNLIQPNIFNQYRVSLSAQKITFGNSLNKDIFVSHDENNTNEQYFNVYIAPSKDIPKDKTTGVPLNYSQILTHLRNNSSISENWIKQNQKLLAKMYGLDISEKFDNTLLEIYTQEFNKNRNEVINEINKIYTQDKINFYNRNRSNIEILNTNNLKQFNYLQAKEKQGEKVEITKAFYTLNTLPNSRKIKAMTNCPVIDLTSNLNEENFIQTVGNALIEAKQNFKNDKKQRTIILIKDLYDKIYNNYDNQFYLFKNISSSTPDDGAVFFIDESVPKTGMHQNRIKFNDIPCYDREKQIISETIIKPLINNTPDCPQIVLFNGNPNDIKQLLIAVGNETGIKIDKINNSITTGDFKNILMEKVQTAENTEEKTFIIIPEVYRYFSGSAGEENKTALSEILESQNRQNHSYVIIMHSKYPENVKEKLNNNISIQDINFHQLTDTEVENIISYNLNKANEKLDLLETKGTAINQITADSKDILELLKLKIKTDNWGYCETSRKMKQSLDDYINNPKVSYNTHLFKNLTDERG